MSHIFFHALRFFHAFSSLVRQISGYKLEGCLNVHLPREITWNAKLMQLGNFINVFLARHVSGTYAHHLRSIGCWVAAYGFWKGCGLESRCVDCVCGADGAVWLSHSTIRTTHTIYAAALKTTTHPKTRCRKPYAATQHLMLLMMGIHTRNMSS